MRKIEFKKAWLAVALLLSALTFQSCNNDDDTDWDRILPNALVTVKQNGDACYLQLDDNTTLLAKNLNKPFGDKEVRALVNYSVTNEKSDLYNQVVHVNWIDEDGYLTLRFRALWGGQKPHYINLVTGVNPENPYEVELRHNVNGDPQNYWRDALVAFNLNEALPDTKGKTVKLTIRWRSSQGYKKVDFDYCSRKSITSTRMLEGYSEAGESIR